MTIFAGDGFGPRFAAGTNSWVEPARNRNNTLQCSCPATVSAFTETRTGPFSPSLPTRFTCSCKRKFVQYGWVGSEPGPLFYDSSLPRSPTERWKAQHFRKGARERSNDRFVVASFFLRKAFRTNANGDKNEWQGWTWNSILIIYNLRIFNEFSGEKSSKILSDIRTEFMEKFRV